MKINMQIALTQDDIANAVRSYLRSEIPLSEDQEIDLTIAYSDRDGVIASAIVTNGEATIRDVKPAITTAGGPRERGKPSAGRMRRTKEEIAEDEAADKADAEAAAAANQVEDHTKVVQTTVFPTETADDRADAEDNSPPFDVDSTTAQTDAQVNVVTETEPAKTMPIFSGNQIFPNAGNSAPAIPPKEAPPVNAKSLFANLPGPTGGIAAH